MQAMRISAPISSRRCARFKSPLIVQSIKGAKQSQVLLGVSQNLRTEKIQKNSLLAFEKWVQEML